MFQSAFYPGGGIDTFGTRAALGGNGEQVEALKGFLKALGKDPDAYGSIITAQQAVTTELIGDVFHKRDEYDELSIEISNNAKPGGVIAGIMADARADAVVSKR